MEQLILIKTLVELQELEVYLQDKDFISYDCETTGLDKESEVIGFSVCADTDKAYYVVLARWDVEQKKLVYLETREGAKKFLQSLVGKALIMHNAVFDCWKAETNFGVELIQSVHTDTMILAHLLDENRFVGLKELGVSVYGEDAKKEQLEMKESVAKNKGILTKEAYELYKADCDLIGKYGAKDTLLTLKLFYHMVPDLYAQGLDKFFYEEESMPLLKGPTYELNTTGLSINGVELQRLKGTLEVECMEAKAFIHNEITPHVKHKYPGTNKSNIFNIGAPKQLSWLMFFQLGNEFHCLTKGGRELCKALNIPIPYSVSAKQDFIRICTHSKGMIYEVSKFNIKTKKMSRPKKVGDPWNYVACGKESLAKYASKYKWVERFLEYSKNLKLLNTYVEGIQTRMKYNIIRPSFLQHGTTSGRYSSRNPNFTNLPRDDKRVKQCIQARPGKVFVGADYAQLEPRVFASFSKDERLLKCFKDGDDFYSVIGAHVFKKDDCTVKKDDSSNSFAVKYKSLRNVAKVIALATPYGTTAFRMAGNLGVTQEEAQTIINDYFEAYPGVELLMLESHEQAKTYGRVENLFGRPRRMPLAKDIDKDYGKSTLHAELPYKIRNILNLAMNHRIQSTASSITNRAMIMFYKQVRDANIANCNLILMVHDEIVVECREEDADKILILLKNSMENAVHLPGVDLIADPKIGKSLSDLK